jgi:uncharacterized protein YkwD
MKRDRAPTCWLAPAEEKLAMGAGHASGTSHRMRLLAVLAAALCLAAVHPHPAEAARPLEKRFAAMVDEIRASAGLAPFSLSDRLSKAARRHSGRMAERREVFHMDLGRFRGGRVSQNVGWGEGLPILLRDFMDSQIHSENLLGDFQRTGIGVVRAGGRVWLTQIFRS